MPDRELIGRILRDARENCGITQQAAAEHLGLSRTLIAQIELGNRPVSPDELSKLGGLYGQSVVDLTGEQSAGDDDVLLVLFDLAPELLSKGVKARVTDVLDLCREVRLLERRLGRGPRRFPRHEQPSPRTAAEALAQGEQVADDERRRLGLSGNSTPDVPDLLASQSVLRAHVDLPDDVAGVFVFHESVGAAVWTNLRQGDPHQRHSLAHEYAHALLDRDRGVLVTKRGNAGELVEKRANAFATAFLMPEEGMRSALGSWDKGQASRRTHIAFDALAQESIRAETRTVPGSQSITQLDIWGLARRFRASYPAVVHRLRALEVLSEADAGALLGAGARRSAERLLSAFGSGFERVRSQPEGGLLDLKFEIVSLAVEGHRRGVVDAPFLERVASKLRLPQLSAARLRELGAAVR